MARTDTLGNFLTDVAEAIRTKKGTTETIQASNFDTEIANLAGGGKYAPRYISFRSYTGTELDEELANLDTSNITNMNFMFAYCTSLTSLDVSHFDTTNVTNMYYMFINCSSLTRLDLSSFYTPNLTDFGRIFSGCTSLQFLDIRNFDFSNATVDATAFADVPKDCEIIVKDDAMKEWFNGWYTTLTNVKTVAELEASA